MPMAEKGVRGKGQVPPTHHGRVKPLSQVARTGVVGAVGFRLRYRGRIGIVGNPISFP
jgi:hypothetical protein